MCEFVIVFMICQNSLNSLNVNKSNVGSFRLLFINSLTKRAEMPRYCFIESCRKTSYKNPNLKLIRFPKNTKTFLCDQHFPSKYFGKKKLKESSYEKIEAILKEEGINVPAEPLAEKIIKNKRRYSRKCVVKHCQLTDTSTKPPVKFVQFPKKGSRLYDVWVKKCNLTKVENDKTYKYVCENHFLDKNDQIPNFNLTPLRDMENSIQLTESVQATNECLTNRNQANCEVYFEDSIYFRLRLNILLLQHSDKGDVISTLNVTLIEEFMDHRQVIKEEPELSINDDLYYDDVDDTT